MSAVEEFNLSKYDCDELMTKGNLQEIYDLWKNNTVKYVRVVVGVCGWIAIVPFNETDQLKALHIKCPNFDHHLPCTMALQGALSTFFTFLRDLMRQYGTAKCLVSCNTQHVHFSIQDRWRKIVSEFAISLTKPPRQFFHWYSATPQTL